MMQIKLVIHTKLTDSKKHDTGFLISKDSILKRGYE